jgi:hypothetical protein
VALKYEPCNEIASLGLSFSSNWSFGWELAVLHTKLSMFGRVFGVCLEEGVEVETKNILQQLMKDHTHFGTSWHAIN